MYKNQKIAVVMPAYNEQLLIAESIGNVPGYVDKLFVVNDCSKDNTLEIVQNLADDDKRIVIINHEVNKGLGQSLIDGYVASRDSDMDITAVMAGDNQMDPADLPALLDALIEDDFDYSKGNRLLHSDIFKMPKYRFIGNSVLTILTKFATGYYNIMDPQSGYTAIKNTALKNIPIEEMTRGYGYNADILNMLNIRSYKVTDVEIRPVYDREQSKIKLWKYIPKTSWILTRLFFRRMWQRYIVLDFHPLILFFMFAFVNFFLIVTPMAVRFIYYYTKYNELPKTTLTILTFSFLLGFQSILFAIWMDMDYNRHR